MTLPAVRFAAWSGAQGEPPAWRKRVVACLQRELHFRRQVYARRVAAHTMKQAEADWQTRVFEAILGDYLREPGDPDANASASTRTR